MRGTINCLSSFDFKESSQYSHLNTWIVIKIVVEPLGYNKALIKWKGLRVSWDAEKMVVLFSAPCYHFHNKFSVLLILSGLYKGHKPRQFWWFRRYLPISINQIIPKDLFIIKKSNQNSSKVTTVLVRIFMNKSLLS